MEINGRFWGSLPLAVAAGAGFALLAHVTAVGAPLPSLPLPVDRLRCRMIATEVKRLLRLWYPAGRIADPLFVRRPLHDTARFLIDFFRPDVSYFVWAADDPRPLWWDVRNVFVRDRRL